MAEEHPGFLGRWARRKSDALQGKPLDEPAAPVQAMRPATAAAVSPVVPKPVAAESQAGTPPPSEEPEKLLSLDDVKALTQESDFKPFMARNVGADVRNAAMKKLFTDPHYNVMDGLDIYIGDYSVADPIPQSMLRQMVGAKLLKIFDDDEDEEKKKALADHSPSTPLPTDALNHPGAEAVAPSGASPDANPGPAMASENFSQSEPIEGPGASPHEHHAHSHLRLQPDHAPSAPSAGGGTS